MKNANDLNVIKMKLREVQKRVGELENSVYSYESATDRMENFEEGLEQYLLDGPEEVLNVESFIRKKLHAYVEEIKTRAKHNTIIEELNKEQEQLVQRFLEVYLAQYQLAITDFPEGMVQSRFRNAMYNLDELYIDWMVYLHRLTPTEDKEYKLLTGLSHSIEFLYPSFIKPRLLERGESEEEYLQTQQGFSVTSQLLGGPKPQNPFMPLQSEYSKIYEQPFERDELLEDEEVVVNELIIQMFGLDFKLDKETLAFDYEDYRVLLKYLEVRWKMIHIVKMDQRELFKRRY